MGMLTKFYLLQYKNWKLQFRKKLVTALEIVIPVFFCLLTMSLRTLVKVDNYPDPTYYPSYSVSKLPTTLVKKIYPFPAPLKFIGIAYTPVSFATDQIMGLAAAKLAEPFSGIFILPQGYNSEEEMVGNLTTDPRTEQLSLCGVVFHNPESYSQSIPTNISYSIRPRYAPRDFTFKLQALNTWNTDLLYSPFQLPGPRDKGSLYDAKPGYYTEGILSLQHALHQSVIEYLNESAIDLFDNFTMERFPYPPYKYDIFLSVIQTQLPFLIMLSMIFISLNIPKEIVLEKERKLKEAMKMMGMSNWLQWLAWFIKYFLFLVITTFLMAFLLCLPVNAPDHFRVLFYADFTLVWVFFILYAVSVISFCFMISVFFDKANAAAAAGGVVFFCLYIPFSFLSPRYDTLTATIKLVSCLDLNLAMSIGMVLVGKFEGTGIGVQWSNLNEPVTVDDNITFGQILLMLLLDSVIYLVIMWYVEAVFPGAYGIPQPPYFFVLPSYWCGMKQKVFQISGLDFNLANGENILGYFEPEPRNVTAGIQIKNLTKTFGKNSSKKTAVNDVTLNMYEGQITALLGHNGAGKTTTMFMLTGFMPPSHGTALVNGYDICTDISGVRSSLGLCPQHDILFDDLTVEEHLYFFAKLKNCPADKIKQQIDYYTSTLGIAEKREAFSKTLSGGQKRKLSVGIALIGDSKVVILDEPTSGMDPSARRHMWDVLQSQRAGRTMILSTHFMDEADHLGDRIAIMADGVVQCCGSSLFLKKKFGAGYHMVMTKKSNCDVENVKALLRKHIPDSTLESNIGAELSFSLPDDKVSSFPDLFHELEQSKEQLGIIGYGASVTTMEEVFMKVGEGKSISDDDKAMDTIKGNGDSHVPYESLDDEGVVSLDDLTLRKVGGKLKKNTGYALFNQQFKAMFLKRVLYTLRNKVLTLSQILLPLIFTSLTVAILKTLPTNDTNAAVMNFDINLYGKTKELYSLGLGGSVSESISKVYPTQFSTNQQPVLVSDPRHEIIRIGERSMKEYNFETIFAVDYNSSNSVNGSEATVLFNAQPYHAAPVALLYADTATLKYFTNASHTFTGSLHPLPQSTRSKIEQLASGGFDFNSFAYSSNVMFGFSFLGSSFVVFLITERSRKIKHSQIVSGVKWYNFWLSTFTWDFVNYLVPALLTATLYAIAKVENLSDISNGNKQPLYVIVLLMLYGVALLPNMYALQFLFTGPAAGYVAVTFYNLLTGLTPQLVVTILSAIESTKNISVSLDWAFVCLLPNYNMGQGLSNLYNNYQFIDLCFNQLPKALNTTLDEICAIGRKNPNVTGFPGGIPCCKDSCGSNCLDYETNYFAWDSPGMGRSVLFLCVQAAIFWFIVILVDTDVLINLFYRIRPKIHLTPESDEEIREDEDVKGEKDKIIYQTELMDAEDNQVVISGLTKYYGTNCAVNDVYLAIPKGECFGLLGVNGAGKTTTFKMLTGDETISGGTAVMNGHDIRTDIHQVQKTIGYCPQFDALIDQMTGEETLFMFARLRGIPEQEIPAIVKNLIEALLLKKHKDKLTRDYSGGNKRKLSTAIALIGDPPVIFLDEPTTGMDPVARRMLWQVLSKVRDSGKTLILTSHSMEECEALCTRMAIMVNGKYRCLGSVQHLKNKFGAGYSLVARIGYPTDGSLPNIASVQQFVEENFPRSVLKDKHQNLVQYHIPKGEISWGNIFKMLEENKKRLDIEDYSVSQTTLEQVFINFARAQIPPNEDQPGCGKRLRQTCCVCCIPEYIVARA